MGSLAGAAAFQKATRVRNGKLKLKRLGFRV